MEKVHKPWSTVHGRSQEQKILITAGNYLLKRKGGFPCIESYGPGTMDGRNYLHGDIVASPCSEVYGLWTMDQLSPLVFIFAA